MPRYEFECERVEDVGFADQVRLVAKDENLPWGEIDFHLNDPRARGSFNMGEPYYVDITPVGEPTNVVTDS